GCFRWTASSLVGSLIVSASFTPGAGPVPTTTGQSPPDNQEVLPTTDDTYCRPSGTCMVSAPGCGAGRSLSAASMVTVAEAGRAQLGGAGARIVVERRHPPLQAGGDPKSGRASCRERG